MTSQNKQDKPRGQSRKLTGVVTSIAGTKTIGVRIDNLIKHPQYGKYIKRSSKLSVHDADGAANIGDTVEIASCRPISKTKSWRLVRVVRASKFAPERQARS